MVKAPGYAYQWSSSYRKARSQFRRQLIESGVPEGEANELAEMYPFKMSDIISTVRNTN